MNEHSSEWPLSFETFRSHRARFLDRMAADALLGEIEAESGRRNRRPKERSVDPIVVQGQLTVMVDERRLILGYFSPGQRDLADVIRGELGTGAEAFGLVDAGDVRITVEFVKPPASAAPDGGV